MRADKMNVGQLRNMEVGQCCIIWWAKDDDEDDIRIDNVLHKLVKKEPHENKVTNKIDLELVFYPIYNGKEDEWDSTEVTIFDWYRDDDISISFCGRGQIYFFQPPNG